MTEKLLPIEPKKYDDSYELADMEEEEYFHVSPHHVPDGLLVRFDTDLGRITARFNYLTSQEETREKRLRSDLWVRFGCNSGRMVGVEFKRFHEWNDVERVLADSRRAVNHYVTFTVLRDIWSDLHRVVQEMEAAGLSVVDSPHLGK